MTCLPGNAALADVARNTRAVLELAGRTDVEVAAGGDAPLRRPLRDHAGDARAARASGTRSCPAPTGALSAAIRRRSSSSTRRGRRPGELTLVTLGRCPTLARALELEPDLPRLLRRWVSMGGAFRVPGNTTPVSEWNVHCDPEAAQVAFAGWQAAIDRDPSTPRALALGLDVTEQARIHTDHVVALAQARRLDAGRHARRDSRSRRPGAPERGEQPGRALRRRRAALVLRVPLPVRRLLRRLHPRPARRRGGARPVARDDRGAGRGRGRRGRARRRPDDRRLARAVGSSPERRHRGRPPTPMRSWSGSSSASATWPRSSRTGAPRGAAARTPRPARRTARGSGRARRSRRSPPARRPRAPRPRRPRSASRRRR